MFLQAIFPFPLLSRIVVNNSFLDSVFYVSRLLFRVFLYLSLNSVSIYST